MLTLFVNNTYTGQFDTPRAIILTGLEFAREAKKRGETWTIVIGNDFGDRWTLEEYIGKIERVTAIRIPEKKELDNI